MVILLSAYYDGYYDQPWLPKGKGTDNYEEKLQQTHKSLWKQRVRIWEVELTFTFKVTQTFV